MAASDDLSVSAVEIVRRRGIRVTLTGAKRVALRLRLGGILLRAARIVIGCRDLHVEFVEE